MNKRGSEIGVGDILIFAGEPHRITRIEPYTHPEVTKGEPGWRTAYADTRDRCGKAAWGITLEPQAGYYEVA